jgi:hypothetical protein
VNQPSKITHAAATGTTYCLGCDSPAHAADEFMALLSRSASWTEPELFEVRRIILARLGVRIAANSLGALRGLARMGLMPA